MSPSGTFILYANIPEMSTLFLDFDAHTFVWASIWSGLRGSNSLPPPWQGGALPDELSPRIGKANDPSQIWTALHDPDEIYENQVNSRSDFHSAKQTEERPRL